MLTKFKTNPARLVSMGLLLPVEVYKGMKTFIVKFFQGYTLKK